MAAAKAWGWSLLLGLVLPRINPHMTFAVIDEIHADVGARLTPGARLFDLTIDLSAVAPHDCPPISHYRLVLRDQAWLRRLDVAAGDTPALGASLALFSTEPEELLDAAPVRAVRLNVASIIRQSAWGES
jgi:hypothetical protein